MEINDGNNYLFTFFEKTIHIKLFAVSTLSFRMVSAEKAICKASKYIIRQFQSKAAATIFILFIMFLIGLIASINFFFLHMLRKNLTCSNTPAPEAKNTVPAIFKKELEMNEKTFRHRQIFQVFLKKITKVLTPLPNQALFRNLAACMKQPRYYKS